MNKKNEWETEPDKKEFTYKGFRCVILRHPELKHLCGYVALPEGNALDGIPYDDININVHGGLTFAKSKTEKHPRFPGYGTVIGFDCAHYTDYNPGVTNEKLKKLTTYRNMAFVEKQCKSMVDQIINGVKITKHDEPKRLASKSINEKELIVKCRKRQ